MWIETIDCDDDVLLLHSSEIKMMRMTHERSIKFTEEISISYKSREFRNDEFNRIKALLFKTTPVISISSEAV